jgi:PEP-CTERM motif
LLWNWQQQNQHLKHKDYIMKTMRLLGLTASLVFAALASTSAGAATWTYSGTGPASSSGLTATATAFSATNNTTATIGATTAYYGGGLGVLSGAETTSSVPNHAMDNNGRIESILISFSDGVNGITSADKVNLSSITVGWSNGDTDFSVYAYNGSATPTTSPLGLTYSNLTSNSWDLIGHYNKSGTGTFAITNSVYSSHWLIGAYNGLGTGMDFSDDYFKMASLTGTKCPTAGTPPAGCNGGGTPGGVPEPGTLLLMGAGFLGLTRMSRRKSA